MKSTGAWIRSQAGRLRCHTMVEHHKALNQPRMSPRRLRRLAIRVSEGAYVGDALEKYVLTLCKDKEQAGHAR